MTDFRLGLKITGDASSATRAAGEAERAVEKVGAASITAGEAAKARLGTGFETAGRAAEVTRGQFMALAGTATAAVAALAGSEFTHILAEYDRLNASLRTVTGSLANAGAASAMIRQFATQTPYELSQVTEAFIKLKSLGLDASERSLRSYGNTASAMGKDIIQFIEAVADATTGEFERLKEFGIKASAQGDKVAFTFQGTTTTIKNDAASIADYLRKIGETQFAGAMAQQMDTVGGKLSNLKDQFGNFVDFLGNLGGRDLLKGFFGETTAWLVNLQKQLNATFGAGLQAQIDAFEMRIAELQREIRSMEQAHAGLLGDFLAPQADIDERKRSLEEMSRVLAGLHDRQRQLTAEQQAALSATTAAGGTGTGSNPQADAQAAKLRISQLKAAQEVMAAQYKEDARLNAEYMAKELEEAQDNAAKKLEIQAAWAEKNRRLKLEESQANLETAQEMQKVNAKDEDTAGIQARILVLQREINAERQIGAVEAATYGIKVQRVSEDQQKSLEALASTAARAQAQLSAAQGILANGGDVKTAKAAADEAARRLDLEKQVAETRQKYAGDQAAQDQAEGYLRGQADAARQLETLTRESADRQASYWVGAWEQAGRTMHDTLTQMLDSLLSGQAKSLNDFLEDFSAGARRIVANTLAGALESEIKDALGSPAAMQSAWSSLSDWASGATTQTAAASSYSAAQVIAAAQTVSYASNAAIPAGSLPYSPNVNAGGASAASQSITQQIAPSVATQAGALPQSATANGATAASGGMGMFGSILGGYGAGMMTSGLGESFGLKGTSQTANSTAPKVGTAAGMAIGTAIFPGVGTVIGGAIGGLVGQMLTPFFHGPIPNAGAWYDYRSGRAVNTWNRSHAGMPVEELQRIGGALADPLNAMQAQFGIDLGDFSYGLEKRGREGREKFTIAGSAGGSEFSRITVNAQDYQIAIDQFEAALLKRKEVLTQFDDDLEKGAIRAGDTLTKIGKTFAQVQSLRTFEGERSSQAANIEQLGTSYRTYQDTIRQTSTGAGRLSELSKLDAAYQKQFAQQVTAYQSALSAFGGGPTSTVADSIAKINATADQLRAQNQELEQAAKKSKGKLSYTPVSETDIESARQAALAKAQTDFIAGLRTLVGTAAPLSAQFADLDRQFRQLSDDAKAAGVDVAALSSVLAAQFAGLVQTQAAPILDARAALAASIDGLQGIDNTLRNVEEARAALANNTNPALELSLIQRVQTAVEARYSSELARLQQLKTGAIQSDARPK